MLLWRKSMKVLIDTNVLLDALLGRTPYFEHADDILKLCADKDVQGYVAAHSITNLFYILRKDLSEEDRRNVLLNLCDILEVEGIDSAKIVSALQNRAFVDFEDCLQSSCAKIAGAKYIITRNIKDFIGSEVQAVTPEEFLIMFNGA